MRSEWWATFAHSPTDTLPPTLVLGRNPRFGASADGYVPVNGESLRHLGGLVAVVDSEGTLDAETRGQPVACEARKSVHHRLIVAV